MGGKVSGLYWLVRKAKDLVVPRVAFIDGPALEDGSSACYYHPFWGELEIVGQESVSLESGLLLITKEVDDQVTFGKNGVAETLAHEWRHHWQWFNHSYLTAKYVDPNLGYKDAIVKFFRQPHELDALMFSHLLAPSEMTKRWLSWVQEST